MSRDSFDETLRKVGPSLQATLQRVVNAIADVPRSELGIDPIDLARRARVDEVSLMAALYVLVINGLGQFAVQTLDRHGRLIEFSSVEAMRDWGRRPFWPWNRVRVPWDKIFIVFRPDPSLTAHRSARVLT